MGCETGKIGYDKKGAVTALNRIKRSHHRQDKYPCRTYECELCGQWHLTSKEEVNDGGRVRPVKLKLGKQFQKLLNKRL